MAARKPPAPTPAPPRSRTIPPALHALALARLAEQNPATLRPYTCSEVARWLGEAHGCPASRLAVQRLRAAAEKHTEAQVVAALREEIAAKVPGVLAKLSRIVKRLDERAGTETNTQKLAAATTAATRALHELATLGGIAAPIALDLTSGGKPLDARSSLAAQLARLAPGPGPGGAGGAGGASE